MQKKKTQRKRVKSYVKKRKKKGRISDLALMLFYLIKFIYAIGRYQLHAKGVNPFNGRFWSKRFSRLQLVPLNDYNVGMVLTIFELGMLFDFFFFFIIKVSKRMRKEERKKFELIILYENGSSDNYLFILIILVQIHVYEN